MKLLLTLVLLAGSIWAQDSAPVTVQLGLADGKEEFRSGEPIYLNLTFRALEGGYSINTTTTDPASPVDRISIKPTAGAYPWLDDYARGRRYSPDYASVGPLEPAKPLTVKLALNDLYRFEAPGRYSAQVETRRVFQGRGFSDKQFPLTSNSVEFSVRLMSDEEEQQEAQRLEQAIRTARHPASARPFVKQLQYLTGDPSTRVKLELFLRPPANSPLGVAGELGLKVARNQALVVAGLEQAMSDPTSRVSNILPLATALRARLAVPFEPQNPSKPLPTDEVEQTYVEKIAATLPARRGPNLASTAQVLLASLVSRKRTDSPVFATVREVLITNLASLSENTVGWFLNAYGEHLQDRRAVSVLEERLRRSYTVHNAGSSSTRAAIFKYLRRMNAESKELLITEICHPSAIIDPEALLESGLDRLPEVDDCLREQLQAFTVNPPRNENLVAHKALFAARFATGAIREQIATLYLNRPSLLPRVRAGLLAYLAWHDERGLAFGEAAFPITDVAAFNGDFNYWFFRAPIAPAVGKFLRSRLLTGPPQHAITAAYQLSRYGNLDDKLLLADRLQQWRARWSSSDNPPPDAEAGLEAELVGALSRAEKWGLSSQEKAALVQGCLTQKCRDWNRLYLGSEGDTHRRHPLPAKGRAGGLTRGDSKEGGGV